MYTTAPLKFNHIKLNLFILLLPFILISCQGIIPGSKLSTADIEHIKSLGLLDSNETIIEFSSQLSNKTSGNFYTLKRVATYWIEDDPEKSQIRSAFYTDIDSISTTDLSTAPTFASYLEIFVHDSSSFRVYVDDDQKATWKFFEGVQKEWNKHP